MISDVPRVNRIVEENNSLHYVSLAIGNLELEVVPDPLERFGQLSPDALVVVPPDVVDTTFQPSPNLKQLFLRGETQISQEVDVIPVGDAFVPVVDDRLVVQLDVFEGALAVADNVSMV
jgi:hypothetical protein